MRTVSVVLATALGLAATLPAFAQPDNKPGHGQGQGKGGGPPASHQPAGPGNAPSPQLNITISDHDRNQVYSYYRQEFAAGNCPPGLAKKHNGCLPPGQAKKVWAIGQPLPAGVIYYPLPGTLLGRLSPAPAGYEYVRVANDILLLGIGTRLVAGALADLSSL